LELENRAETLNASSKENAMPIENPLKLTKNEFPPGGEPYPTCVPLLSELRELLAQLPALALL
jgi:hypothetical protein